MPARFAQLFCALLKNRDGSKKDEARLYLPKDGHLRVPDTASLHGRPMLRVLDAENCEKLDIAVWPEGLAFRFQDRQEHFLTYDDVYFAITGAPVDLET